MRQRQRNTVRLVLIWLATFITFAIVGISLSITTNPIYFLLVIVGVLMSTLVTEYYQSEQSRASGSENTCARLCRARLETHSPVYVEEKATFYPLVHALHSAHSEPCFCNTACSSSSSVSAVPLRRSCSSPRVYQQWVNNRSRAPTVEFALEHVRADDVLWDEPRCEQVESVSYHKPYICYGTRTFGLYVHDSIGSSLSSSQNRVEKDEKDDRGGKATDDKPQPNEKTRPADTVIDMAGIEESEDFKPSAPPREAIEQEDTDSKEIEPRLAPLRTTSSRQTNVSSGSRKKEGANGKQKRRLLWNMFAPGEDKPVLKDVRSDVSSSSGPSVEEPALTRPNSIASAPEYRKVVATIQKNIREGRRRKDGGKENAESASLSRGKERPARASWSKGQQEVKSSSRSTLDSSVDDLALASHNPTIRTALPGATAVASSEKWPESPRERWESEDLARASLHKTLVGDPRQEMAVMGEATPEEDAPIEFLKEDLVEAPDENPRPLSPSALRQKGSQTSMNALTSIGGSTGGGQAFQLPPWVKAEHVEVTVINNPQHEPSSSRFPASESSPSASKSVQASCKTSNAAVQIQEDGDGKVKGKRKFRFIPRFLKRRSKKYKHLK
ncbi:uncharacterized protein LOC135366234 [Ornithodoros turicata]|uniref:uncharacterized protein LOC135366234 n=1 Tax=Ornithodoros turicata TaxID=34597 RepID=UPI003138C60F